MLAEFSFSYTKRSSFDLFIQTYQPFDLLEVAIGFRRCGFWSIHAASRIRDAVKHALQDSRQKLLLVTLPCWNRRKSELLADAGRS
jgi:hypothetical protein